MTTRPAPKDRLARRRRMSKSERGQAMAEYSIIVAWLSVVLFVPLFPDPDGGRASIAMLFVQVFDIYINSFHTVIGLPIP